MMLIEWKFLIWINASRRLNINVKEEVRRQHFLFEKTEIFRFFSSIISFLLLGDNLIGICTFFGKLCPIVVFMILVFCSLILGEPGYLDFDNLPETNFTCAGKVIGGYYADLETSCQMFHVCTIGQLEEPMDIKFLCLNGTVFDQETRVCERVDEVDCTKSERFYYLNLELYGNTMVPIPEDNIITHSLCNHNRQKL
ncbi:hypothetical protein Bhyg_02318 [Pseudolycoriella hygida]|uniref:Chitin-binding type-2 domain-containing protein n=1 Tax=Pseudolycoriella hygida TaxID=35572 RepID=A0A9Q0NBL6_9DIPT|nr:hypothetical protein Bhyg_02318 [Pseudolycoriella hygida]